MQPHGVFRQYRPRRYRRRGGADRRAAVGADRGGGPSMSMSMSRRWRRRCCCRKMRCCLPHLGTARARRARKTWGAMAVENLRALCGRRADSKPGELSASPGGSALARPLPHRLTPVPAGKARHRFHYRRSGSGRPRAAADRPAPDGSPWLPCARNDRWCAPRASRRPAPAGWPSRENSSPRKIYA